MTLESIKFCIRASISDYKRNSSTTHPSGVVCIEDIRYGSHGKWNLLNVYYPEGTDRPLPTIVSIHGGGFVYGSKEIYHHYCADLARRGFTVVNFNYRLAPRWKFPAPLQDTNKVMQWLIARAAQYHMDPDKVFIVGDSAGAQLASQYAAIVTNPQYAAHFFKVPPFRLRAVGLNCGMYDKLIDESSGLKRDYIEKNADPADPRYDVLGAITSAYPPCHITTAHHDFLRDCAEPMYELIASRGVACQWKCYGAEDQEHIAHVFHVDIRYPEAAVCNDEQTQFFRKYL